MTKKDIKKDIMAVRDEVHRLQDKPPKIQITGLMTAKITLQKN